MRINSIEDILAIKESYDVELKKATGKDGRGSVPDSFWETYSAFANTDGGYIFLGIEENKNDKTISISGIVDYEQIQQNLHNLANNKQRVSHNLLNNNSITKLVFDNKVVLRVYIPKATRKNKPVYVKENPLKGSYFRRNEGDYLLDDHSIKKMLSEQREDSADSLILKGFNYEDDLENETVIAYRNSFASLNPTHPFVSKNMLDFLTNIGAYGKDRESGIKGLTLAGLLMFGKLSSILEEVPNYILDYQERPEAKTENRWIDRITTDGTWSGNLFDFYRRVYSKITADLKVPFRLENGIRIDETPIHEALRESFVNSLIHADYSGRVSILVVKRPDMFGFRNPGLMRVPIEQALEGGDSDCRNRKLQKMFQLIGAGDQAGSGIPKIYQNWKQQHWRTPLIKEKRDPEQTLFELHTVSLIDKKSIEILDNKFGKDFRNLQELERLILATAVTEETVNHKRIDEMSTEHASDISKLFSKLTKEGFLVKKGEGRGTSYSLNEDGFVIQKSNSGGLSDNSGGLSDNSGGLPLQTANYEALAKNISELTVARKKLPKADMENSIIQLCSLKPHSREDLARLLNRNTDFIRKEYIAPMLSQKKIIAIYPDPNHPMQAYKSNAWQ